MALVTEGTYPGHRGGVSVWCDQLIRGLPDVRFTVVAICLTQRDGAIWDLPDNAELTRLPIWDHGLEAIEGRGGGSGRRRPTALRRLVRLITTPPDDGEIDTFLAVVDELIDAARDGTLSGALRYPILCDLMADAVIRSTWLRRTHHATMLDAARLAENLTHLLRPLLVDLGPIDSVHLTACGLPSLVGLAMERRRGVPFVVTEHGLFLRERYLDLGRAGVSPAQRAVMLRFYHLLVAATYRRAAVIAPVSSFNQRWQERLGAAAERIRLIHSAVDPAAFPVRTVEPDRPSVAWLGRIDPIKDLHTLIRAAGDLHEQRPDVTVHLYGSAAPAQQGYLASCRELVERLGLTGTVRFEGPVATPADAYHACQISALSSISEGFPYVVLESMACGVPVVGTDVGGVREAIGDGGRCVPAGDHLALASACLELIERPRLRRLLGRAGRRRVETRFDLATMLRAHDELYQELCGGAPTLDPGPAALDPGAATIPAGPGLELDLVSQEPSPEVAPR